MEQLIQNLKDGKMELMEVPFPALKPGCVLVRNHFSVISAGTEGKTVKDARLGYIGKARSRKDDVAKVIQSAKTHGMMKTYRMVMNKLEAPSPLGYSCAGEVIAVADDVSGFSVGDLVACGGNSANHSEVICAPVNLCAKVGSKTNLEDAAFTTIAAIAMQGVRQAELNLGENCAVIGLGLIGQLTIKLLQAAGVTPIGIDIDQQQVENAQKIGCNHSFSTSNNSTLENIMTLTRGAGVDAVIITAGTSSADPVDLAGEIARQKAKVVIVGAVNTGFSRKNYFRKELDLRMSCSYGPGRYNTNFEEKGLDYPIGYVRWTEQRNMQAFLDLLDSGKIDLEGIVTHRFNFEEATKAYQLIVDRSERFSGITLKYDVNKELKAAAIQLSSQPVKSGLNIGFIGAGSFAQNFLLPNLGEKVNLTGVCTSRGNTARNIAEKYGFRTCSTDALELLHSNDTDTVFIATRHDTHYQYAKAALEAKKNVFLEKPLCLSEEELDSIIQVEAKSEATLMLGFNRRFAPQIVELKSQLNNTVPIAINYRINAGIVPPDHWVHDPEVGGGRVLGEACHFVDLCRFLAGSRIVSVSANALDNGQNLSDSVIIQLAFENGSIASISYLSNGNKAVAKERLEVFALGSVAVIDDFKIATGFGFNFANGKIKQDKGHRAEITTFLAAIEQGNPIPIPFHETVESTRATFAVLQSIRESGVVKLN